MSGTARQSNKQKDKNKMKNIETTIEEIKAKAERQIREAQTEFAIQEAVGRECRVFISALYGSEASVEFFGGFRGERATPAQVAELFRAFPPLPMLLRKDGCTSFPLESWFDALPKDKQKGEVRLLAPWVMKANFSCVPDHGHEPETETEWYSEIAGIVCRVSARMSTHAAMSYQFKSKSRQNTKGLIIETVVGFRKGWAAWEGDAVPVLHHQDGGDNAERMSVIRWGRGCDKTGHNFTFYSGCSDADPVHHFERLAALTA